MKKTDKKMKALQQGGLMIEALAMLGLIAVVTPTMYKKSAERTLEVEDINTASTVRTYMNAAEAYIANNYGDLMTNVFSEVEKDEEGNVINQNKLIPKPNGTIYKLTEEKGNGELAPYLPYKFDTDRALYDYKTPKVIITNNGTNLTAFVLFPAKQGADDGIGQERTSRIASLIGSNGGYMPDGSTARGVGGIWNLDSTTLTNMFGSDHNQYSLVAASSNVISDVNGGDLDNDKYLQRTLEGNPEDPSSYADQLWRNTMHTDLYMGDYQSHQMTGETQSIASQLVGYNSIRNVRSMIIGAEKAPMQTTGEGEDAVTSETKNNGLYIAGVDGNDYADAYIGGALRATAEHFVTTARGGLNPDSTNTAYGAGQMVFGKVGTTSKYNFELQDTGDIYDEGKTGILFNRFASTNNNFIGIGGDASDTANPTNWLIQISKPNGVLDMHLVDDDTFHIYDNIDGEGTVTDKQMDIMTNGYKGMPKQVHPNGDGTNTTTGPNEDALGNSIGPKYSNSYNTPQFPVYVGSNMKVQGIMAAGQVDTTVTRTATLQAGSTNINDDYKWMEVDNDGVRIRDRSKRFSAGKDDTGKGTSLMADSQGIGLRVGSHSNATVDNNTGFDGHPTQIVMRSSKTGSEGTAQTISEINARANNVLVRNQDMNNIPGTTTIRNSKVELKLGYGSSTSTDESGNPTTSYRGELMISGLYDSPVATGATNSYANYNVRQIGGHHVLQGSNLTVVDLSHNPVFSVHANNLNNLQSSLVNSYTSGENPDYFVSAHGSALFTSNKTEQVTSGESTVSRGELKYLSVGKYASDAGVSIIAPGKTATNAIKNVVVIDQSQHVKSIGSALPDNSFKLTQYTASGEKATTFSKVSNIGEPGTIYMRKGMIDIVSEGNKDADKTFLAHEGAGVVRAARFVANNVDSNGFAAAVPTKLTRKEANLYNTGSEDKTFVRYDTYMVNPAYTSVMNDIKLASRGGARLSDILPDFINKGIYVANNTNTNFPTFKGWNSIEYTTASAKGEVSPFLGGVPAPQCPPGYGKVITVAPVGFKMAQAGGIDVNASGLLGKEFKAREDENGPGYSFKSASSTESWIDKFEEDENGKRQVDNYLPDYNVLRAGLEEGPADIHLSGTVHENWSNYSGTDGGTFDLTLDHDFALSDMSNNFPVKMCDKTKEVTDGKDCTLATTYVLSSGTQHGFKPLIFQQSTYLKTLVIPLCANSEASTYNHKCTNYTQGWAVLMGFIYPKTLYKGVIEYLGLENTNYELAEDTSNNEKWYWNIFPVIKGSLEAYATVYCFYDKTNIFGGYKDSYKESYDYLNAATNYNPTGDDKTRRQDLNDPTLQYNELW